MSGNRRSAIVALLFAATLGACKFSFDRQLSPGELRGHLVVEAVDGTRTPAADAKVQIIGSQLSAKVDAQGRFVFRSLTAGTYALKILRDVDGSGKLSTALFLQNVVIEQDGNQAGARDLGDVVVTALGGLDGSVTKATEPQPGAKVVIRNLDQQVVDTAGKFSFTKLPAGDYQLYVLDTNNNLFAGSPGEGVKVTIKPRQVATVSLEIQSLVPAQPGTVAGQTQVAGKGGEPAVSVNLSGGPSQQTGYQTGDDGVYNGSDVPAGVYTFIGHKDGNADAVLSMSADTANRYWQGKVSLPLAMAKGKLKVGGSAAQLLKLAPIAKDLYPVYVAMLKEDHRDDLVVS